MPSRSGAIEYCVELFDSTSDFGPGAKLAEIWDARNVGWSKYDRIPGKAFLTLPQSSPLISLFEPLTTHIAITQVDRTTNTLLYRGEFIEPNSTGDDVILDCYDYKALLSLSRAGFKTLYPSKKIGTEVVAPEWALAKGATSSILGFVSTGTIEDPLGDDAVTALTVSQGFGTLDQNRLQLIYDLTEMGRANTFNQVTFDIDLTNTFKFVRNDGVNVEEAFVLNGNVSDYQYIPGFMRYRNDLATVGTEDVGGASELVATDATEIAARGLRQDVTTLRTLLGITSSTVEHDQQVAALQYQLRKFSQLRPAIGLDLMSEFVRPYDGWAINDKAFVEIKNGRDDIDGRWRIVGVRGLYTETGPDVTVFLDPIATSGTTPT